MGASFANAQGSLRVQEGVVVKFGADAGLQVRTRLQTANDVTFTSMSDDASAGQVGSAPATAKAGDWWGVFIDGNVQPSDLSLSGLKLQFGGGVADLPQYLQGGAALNLSGAAYQFSGLKLSHNVAGVRVTGAGSPSFKNIQFNGNGVGLIAELGATPRIESSDISGNTEYGVQNLSPTSVVLAQGNWWGHASGPRDAGNPGGQGDRVSAGVDYGQFLSGLPLFTQGPTIALTFAGQPLAAGATISEPGQLGFAIESSANVARVQASINGLSIFNQSYANLPQVTQTQFVDFAPLPNGSHRLVVTAWDSNGVSSEVEIPFTLAMAAPSVPVINTPANGSTVSTSQVSVAGTAQPGSQVQVYLNGAAAGAAVTASQSGSFATTIQIPAGEGNHRIHATASTSRGTSAPSGEVSFAVVHSVPTLVFVSPANNATLSVDTTIEVSAADVSGITKVDLYAGSELIATRTQAPWSATWAVSQATDGAYTLKAVATNAAGKTAEVTRQVQVQKTIVPDVPVAPYVARNVVVTPGLSWGNSPVQISGEIVTSDASAQLVPNASMRLVLKVQGFERKINLVGDAQGKFSYTFSPSATDAGTYEVRVVHPSDARYAQQPAQGSFTINRLNAEYSQFKLNAIRTVASPAVIRVAASAGTGATGVHWKAVPADQPSGSLPPGITLDLGAPIDIAAGTAVPTTIRLTGSASAGQAGTIILKLFANESGDQPRAELRLDYQLHEARPGLVPQPTALELGVKQGERVSGKITLTNKGYTAALNAKAQLFARGGGAAPAWVRLASGSDIGDVDVGASTAIQVDASPDASVPDGYVQLEIRVSADNDSGGIIPVTIAVSRSGEGHLRMKLVDIYTNTLDAQGRPIEGLAGARITLQNEALTGDIRSATSDASGIAEFNAIPPGNYRWRASAANHMDASGRITVYAGLTANERVFMDYQLVSIEFSVTETTIRDVYDIVLEATFQTQVPAPVVLMEPMSINLPSMQAGEELTGELTLSNYGLVRADNLKFALPSSDANFRYEFFGDLPKQLEAKSRVVIPYRITAVQAVKSGVELNMEPARQLDRLLGAGYQPGPQIQNAVRQFLQRGTMDGMNTQSAAAKSVLQAAAKAASCSSYQTQSCVAYDYDCAAGDTRGGSACSSFSRVTGQSCGSGGAGSVGTPQCPGGSCGNGGGWGGGWWGSGAAQALTPYCIPDCVDCSAGGGPGGGGGGGPGGPSGPPGGGPTAL